MKRIIIVAIILTIAIAGLYGYKMYRQKTPDVVNKKPDVVTTATQLIAAFDKDSALANKEYSGKLIEVTGIAKSKDTSAILLGERTSRSTVRCGIDRRHMEDFKKISVGSVVTVQGKYTGYEMEEMLGENLGTTVTLSFAGVKEKTEK